MAFDYDETNPVASSFIADYPANEVAQRTAVLGSVNVEHFAETTGFHRRVAMVPLAVDPTLSVTNGFVYTKTVSAITELFYEDDAGKVVQLTQDGSASPDKLPLAGGTMTGDLIMNSGNILMQGTSLIRLLNAKKIEGRDAGDANWRDLVGIDASDVSEFGDVLLGGGLRLLADGVDEAKVEYGSGDKKIWHAGHFAKIPIFDTKYTSGDVVFISGSGNTRGTVAHGLPSRPTLWYASLKCVSAEHGYGVDDELPIMQSASVSINHNIGVYTQGSTLFGWAAPSNQVSIQRTDNAASASIDDSKWVIVFHAWYIA